MRLTIVTIDKAVGIDGLFYDNLDLAACGVPDDVWALQWNGSSGHIEFNGTIANQDITALPAWADACVDLWNVANTPIPPTSDQIIAANKEKAENLLLWSDWSVLPDVALANKTEWEAYRSALRQIAISPTIDPVWPQKPESVWQ